MEIASCSSNAATARQVRCMDESDGVSDAASADGGQRRSPWTCAQQRRGWLIALGEALRRERRQIQRHQHEGRSESHDRRMRKHHAIAATCGRIIGMAGEAMLMMAGVVRAHGAIGIHLHAGHGGTRHLRDRHRAGYHRHQHDQCHGGECQPCHNSLMCHAVQHAQIPSRHPSLEQGPHIMTLKRKKFMRRAAAWSAK